jgi:hypothetical protein
MAELCLLVEDICISDNSGLPMKGKKQQGEINEDD